MAKRPNIPEADLQEQNEAAGAAAEPLPNVIAGVEAPEADVLEQHTPAGPQPEALQMPASPRLPLAHIPEADALEQALPADHELFEDDE